MGVKIVGLTIKSEGLASLPLQCERLDWISFDSQQPSNDSSCPYYIYYAKLFTTGKNGSDETNTKEH